MCVPNREFVPTFTSRSKPLDSRKLCFSCMCAAHICIRRPCNKEVAWFALITVLGKDFNKSKMCLFPRWFLRFPNNNVTLFFFFMFVLKY